MSVIKRSPENPAFNDHLNINVIRKVIREQTNLSFKYNSNDSGDSDVEVPTKQYPPLPGIPRVDDSYYRTESTLIKHDIDDLRAASSHSNKFDIENTILPQKYPIEFQNKREVKHHFASSKTQHRPIVHRLPALDKQLGTKYALQNAMDLDEDLPESLENNKLLNVRQRMTYTSPGDRTISPIKRPQAPSPPNSSINFRKKTIHADSDSDDDDSL